MTRSFISLFGLMHGQDVRRTAIAATRSGYAVVPVAAGGKAPVCTLNTVQLRAAGRIHSCGVAHAITDPIQAGLIFGRISPRGLCNIGVVAGPSRLIIVDCDTQEEVQAFLDLWAAAEDDPGYLAHTPTVMTPGQMDEYGAWQHKDGGHFYFDLPAGVELSWEHRSALVAPGGFLVKWGASQVVAPPSVRPEGRYLATGDIVEAPAFLVDMIVAEIAAVARHRTEAGEIFKNDDIAAWSVRTTWAELLEPRGWTSTGKHERSCGCEIWTKPGGGTTSPRSAIAHEPGCQEYPLQEGHGPLYLFTTDPGPELEGFIAAGRHAITKLQYVAAYDYAGDEIAAQVGMGIGQETREWIDGLDAESPIPGVSQGSGDSPDHEVPLPTDDVTGEDPFFTADEIQAGVTERIKHLAAQEQLRRRAGEFLDFKIGGASLRMSITQASDIVPVTMTADVAHRTDGVALLYRGRVNTIWGPSDSGKSWFTIAGALDVVAKGGRVLLIDTEDDESGLWYRLDLLGAVTDRISYIRMWTRPDSRESVELLAAAAVADLVIIDSLDGYLALFRDADSNSATQVRSAGALMKRWAQAGNAAVLVVDHSTEKIQPGQKAATALGSSAKKQLIDGVMLRADRETVWKPMVECRTMIMLGKDRQGQTKAWAEFENEDSAWGRVAHLVMFSSPAGSELRILPPPSYASQPVLVPLSTDERDAIEADVLAFLAKTPGEWQTRTAVLKAAGDKNNRGPQGQVVEAMVTDGLIEALRGGSDKRPLTSYRALTRGDTESPDPGIYRTPGSGDSRADTDTDTDNDTPEEL